MQVYSTDALLIPPPIEYIEDVLSGFREKVLLSVTIILEMMKESGYKTYIFETDEVSALLPDNIATRLATLSNLDRMFVSKNCNIQLTDSSTRFSELIKKSAERYKTNTKDKFNLIVDRDLYVKRRIVKEFKTIVFFENSMQQIKFKPKNEGQLSIIIGRNLMANTYMGAKEISLDNALFKGAGLIPVYEWRNRNESRC